MRGFLLGFILVVALGVIVLSIRPGGLRRQLRFAARRLRLLLVLGTIYVIGAGVLRALFSDGPVTDFGPPVLACVLLVAFLILGQDPATPTGRTES
ncbi:MAG TPA: hypothetical protein VIP57_14915 [Candidatus Dormibacteraeota bacterium]